MGRISKRKGGRGGGSGRGKGGGRGGGPARPTAAARTADLDSDDDSTYDDLPQLMERHGSGSSSEDGDRNDNSSSDDDGSEPPPPLAKRASLAGDSSSSDDEGPPPLTDRGNFGDDTSSDDDDGSLRNAGSSSRRTASTAVPGWNTPTLLRPNHVPQQQHRTNIAAATSTAHGLAGATVRTDPKGKAQHKMQQQPSQTQQQRARQPPQNRNANGVRNRNDATDSSDSDDDVPPLLDRDFGGLNSSPSSSDEDEDNGVRRSRRSDQSRPPSVGTSTTMTMTSTQQQRMLNDDGRGPYGQHTTKNPARPPAPPPKPKIDPAKIDLVQNACKWLSEQQFRNQKNSDKLKVQAPDRFKSLLDKESRHVSLIALVSTLFPSNVASWREKEPLWVLASEATSSELLRKMVDSKSPIPTFAQDHVRVQAMDILKLVCKKERKRDLMALFHKENDGSCVVLPVPAKLLPELLDQKHHDDFRNTLGGLLTEIQLDSSADEAAVRHVLKGEFGLGKNARKCIDSALKAARNRLKEEARKKAESARSKNDQTPDKIGWTNESKESVDDNDADKKQGDRAESPTQVDEFAPFQQEIENALKWYVEKMNKHVLAEMPSVKSESGGGKEDVIEDRTETFVRQGQQQKVVGDSKISMIAFTDIAKELDKCKDLSDQDAENQLDMIAKSLDLSTWSETSTWVVELTEQAHKFFRKHLKKEHKLCDKVLRRLQLLATGRWPYVLCKPLRTSSSTSVNLYETKVDKARRIIWEVSISFSPRRSTVGKPIAEQVIKVWDICDDHDNLTRDIDLVVQRIEKSYIRGQQCIMYSNIEGFGKSAQDQESKPKDGTIVPRTFAMKQEFKPENTAVPEDSYFAPANHDENQFNLLKFYEVNAAAVQILLDSKTADIDLPFVPGPRENEIIKKDTKRSLLLMGRSGTGKTTCMVFRIWSQYKSYYDDMHEAPRQLFVTKNTILRNEVERSFRNMSMAYSNIDPETNKTIGDNGRLQSNDAFAFPIFMTSADWLDALDAYLPGARFFSQAEAEVRGRGRSKDGDDVVQRGMEELDDVDEDFPASNKEKRTLVRREIDFTEFRSLWPKINSKVKSKLNESLVWLEIISHIKGSMTSLKLGQRPDETQPFLSREEYLALPRKQSRLDQTSREIVYSLYERYEELKKKNHFFDVMDLVHSVARRIPAFLESDDYHAKKSFLPVDSVFVDEVQDFTQAELYILAKLCSSQNTLFLAGDTAQTIAVGVGFRFEDARQVLYETFSGNKPEIEKLCENYRSHKGVLQLAASVVELLYKFFPESLDRMPPDFGLFPGPQPIILKSRSMDDLVLRMAGAKRESTSRIEFGAHQVVIVRDEEAKKRIPDGIGIDREFVMTVAESKGLEFDDVLLLDFFSTSPANDFWRVVANYSQKEVQEYHESCMNDSSYSAAAAVNKTFYWEDIPPSDETRPLPFNADEHKILEGELKQLYTAITRSRVKVFIAETQEESYGRAVFNYWRRRHLVKESDSSDEIDLMGKTNTPEEWVDRGSYYYRMATSDQLNHAALRLAIKCFENGGDEIQATKAKAYLEFAEFEETFRQNRSRRWRSSPAFKRRSYMVAKLLMDTKEIELLSRAALCLVRIGKEETSRAARLFECHGIWHYRKFGHFLSKPSETAIASFSYSGKLYKKAGKYVDAFRCLVASGGAIEMRQAVDLLREHQYSFSTDFNKLASAWSGHDNEAIKYWKEKEASKEMATVGLAITDIAEVAAHTCCARNDEEGLIVALSAVSSGSHRIRICQELDGGSPELPWSDSPSPRHETQRDIKDKSNGKGSIDVGKLISTKLGGGKEASRFLESRGQLLEAADLLSSHDMSADNERQIFRLKLLYLELMMFETPENVRSESLSSLEALAHSLSKASNGIPDLQPSELAVLGLCRLRLKPNDPREAVNAYKLCKESGNVLYLSDAVSLILQQRNGMETMSSKEISGSDDTWETFRIIERTVMQLQQISRDLRSNNVDVRTQFQSNSYYHLQSIPQYSNLLELSTATSRLGKPLKDANAKLPVVSSALSSPLVARIDKEKAYEILAFSVWMRSIYLLEEYDLLIDNMIPAPARYLRLGLKSEDETGSNRVHEQTLFWQLTQVRAIVNQYIVTGCKIGKNTFRTDILEATLKQAESNKLDFLTDLQKDVSRTLAPIIIVPSGSRPSQGLSNRSSYKELTLYLTHDVLKMMFEDQEMRYDSLDVQTQRSDFEGLFRLWQLASLNGNEDILEKKMKRLENVEDFDDDQIGKLCIGSRTKFEKTQGKESRVKSVTHVFRLFAWSVGARNIFNSVKCTLECIKVTSTTQGLKAMSKLDQLTFLEASTTAIFGVVSLRLSSSQKKSGELMVLPQSFVSSYLSNETATGLRGVQWNTSMAKTEADKKQSSKFFHQVVFLLESVCLTLLNSGSFDADTSDPEGLLVFVRAVVLGTSIILNAYLIYAFGDESIDPTSAELMNSSVLPKYPLGGKIYLLLSRLSCVLNSRTTQNICRDTNLKEALSTIDADVHSVLDALNSFLMDRVGDHLSFFGIQKADNGNCLDVIKYGSEDMTSLSITRHLDGLLIEEIKNTNKQEGLPCYNFLSHVDIPSTDPGRRLGTATPDLTADEIAAIARRDDEELARTMLGRFAYRILNKGLLSTSFLRQRITNIRRMKRFVAICAQKMIIEPKFRDPFTWMPLLHTDITSISSLPDPFDFPAFVVFHRREKRMFLLEKSADDPVPRVQKKTEQSNHDRSSFDLLEYGRLASDCEICRFRLEQCLRVCENNIKMGGSYTSKWVRFRQEVTVEVETLNDYLSTIISIVENRYETSSIRPHPSKVDARIKSARDDVDNFFAQKIDEENTRQQDEPDGDVDEDPYDGDDDGDDDYDYDFDDDYDDSDYYGKVPSSASSRRKKG